MSSRRRVGRSARRNTGRSVGRSARRNAGRRNPATLVSGRSSSSKTVSYGLTANEWLLVAFGILTVAGVTYYVYDTTVWPPSADVQQGVVNQILAANTAMGGQAPTAAQAAALAGDVANMPAQYVASLPTGTTPTVAGYQTWVLGNVSSYVASGGNPGGFVGS